MLLARRRREERAGEAVRLRRRFAFGVVAALGAATAVLPALAGSETIPAVEAVNVGGGIYGEEHHWSPAQVAVAVGGTVSLSNPTEVKHGVYWVGGPSKPSCSAAAFSDSPSVRAMS